jgi:hypothetical protein
MKVTRCAVLGALVCTILSACTGALAYTGLENGASGQLLPVPNRVYYYMQGDEDDKTFKKYEDIRVFSRNADGSTSQIPIDNVAIIVNNASPGPDGVVSFYSAGEGRVQVYYESKSAGYDIIIWDAHKGDIPEPPGIPGTGGGITIEITGP